MIRKILCIAICALALVGCQKSPDVPELLCSVVTGDVSDVTPFSATISARYFRYSFMVDTQERGIYCSLDHNPGPENSFDPFNWWWGDDDWKFFQFNNLEPATTYYYRVFMRYKYISQEKIELGEVKSFTTPAE